ncbi:MAG: DUF1566 domain-containing protein [Spirochaetales bacterium]|nr:DUF1566 domain-containing protein [Spirochaetales bacterium]
MKKIFFFLFAAVMTACFISCINEYEYTIETTYGPITYIGTKKPNETRAVGDIVFTDGSATPYSATLTLTDDQKNAAVAVIYKVVGTDSYGVGLVHASDLAWCTETANGYAKIETIACTNTGTTFSGDTDGSNNFTQIGTALGQNDDTGTADKYPAFYFAKNYKDATGSHVSGTIYQNNWYLPSVSELYDVFSVKSSINPAITLCGGNSLGDCSYWSSSQDNSSNNTAWTIQFQNGGINSSSKASTEKHTRCIHKF